MLASAVEHPDNRALWIGEISAEWLRERFPGFIEAHAGEEEPADAHYLLERAFTNPS